MCCYNSFQKNQYLLSFQPWTYHHALLLGKAGLYPQPSSQEKCSWTFIRELFPHHLKKRTKSFPQPPSQENSHKHLRENFFHQHLKKTTKSFSPWQSRSLCSTFAIEKKTRILSKFARERKTVFLINIWKWKFFFFSSSQGHNFFQLFLGCICVLDEVVKVVLLLYLRLEKHFSSIQWHILLNVLRRLKKIAFLFFAADFDNLCEFCHQLLFMLKHFASAG